MKKTNTRRNESTNVMTKTYSKYIMFCFVFFKFV